MLTFVLTSIPVPGQQRVGGSSEVPNVVCYDADGNIVVIGSETDVDTDPELSEIFFF